MGEEVEYQAMTLTMCELVWLKQLLEELKLCNTSPMKLNCDNHASLHIVSNSVFHDKTKHIEIDYHFLCEKIFSGEIITSFINSNDRPADIFTKSLQRSKGLTYVTYRCILHIMLQLEECWK